MQTYYAISINDFISFVIEDVADFYALCGKTFFATKYDIRQEIRINPYTDFGFKKLFEAAEIARLNPTELNQRTV